MGWKEELQEFEREFGKETDRAAVILAAAKIDELLRLAIMKRLAPSPRSHDSLLESEGPLGTFSARIDVAHRLKLIDKAFARTLHVIRKIRNDFAHKPTASSLSSGPHADRVRELARPWLEILKEIQKLKPKSRWNTPRGQFRFIVGYSMVRLNELVKHADEIEALPRPLGIFMEPVEELE